MSSIKWDKYPENIKKKDVIKIFTENPKIIVIATAKMLENKAPNQNECVIPLCFVGKNLMNK